MTAFGGDLYASRVKGSVRQLFGNDSSSGSGDVLIRPEETRRSKLLAAKIGDALAFGEAACGVPGNVAVGRACPLACSALEFQSRVMRGAGQQVPCMLEATGGPGAPGCWPAGEECWGSSALVDALGDEFRCELKDSNATCLLGDYLRYCGSASAALDDNPAYLWETLVAGESPAHDLLISKFCCPALLRAGAEAGAGAGADEGRFLHGVHEPGDRADLLSFAGDDGLAFGLHRWLLIGPARSGSALHVDPLGTSAWNTLLLGTKLWAVLPPDGDGEGEEGGGEGEEGEEEEEEGEEGEDEGVCAAQWFAEQLPLLVAAAAAAAATTTNTPPAAPQPPQPQCFLQREGETVYMPAGWRHAVLNLSQTVCVTQNWAEPANLGLVTRRVFAEAAFSHEGKDGWRLGVRAAGLSGSRSGPRPGPGTWEDVGDGDGDGDGDELCVHCGRGTAGNVFALFQDRPVCAACEAARREYSLCSAAVAEALGVCMWRLSGRDAAPSVAVGGRGRCFLLADVLRARATCPYARVSPGATGGAGRRGGRGGGGGSGAGGGSGRGGASDHARGKGGGGGDRRNRGRGS